MPRHTITVEEMSDHINRDDWSIVACSVDEHSRKRLEASTKGMFRVTDRDEIKYYGASLGAAVDAYNEAP